SRSRRPVSSTPPSRRTGSSARSDSIARRAWVRSRASGETRWNPIDAVAESAFTRMSATPTFSSASRSCCSVGSASSSATDRLRRPDLLGVDLPGRGAVREALDLTLGRVLLRNGEERRSADLLRDREHPGHKIVQPLPRRDGLASGEVDELAREAVADGSPEVLLDVTVREGLDRVALVVGTRDAGDEGGRERRESIALRELWLTVADSDLDRRERQMRADAPPQLRVLADGARFVEETNEPLVLGPRGEGVRDAAAREEPREDLGP